MEPVRVDFAGAAHGRIILDAESYITEEGFGQRPRIYPVTIVQSRYNGSYEGGLQAATWLCFPCEAHYLGSPRWNNWNASDLECAEFWRQVKEEEWPIGRGSTPTLAYEDLIKAVCRRAGVEWLAFCEPPTWKAHISGSGETAATPDPNPGES